MIMDEQEKFENSVNVLTKAYHDGSLKYGSCTSCAVGILVGAAAYPNRVVSSRHYNYMFEDGSTIEPSWYDMLIYIKKSVKGFTQDELISMHPLKRRVDLAEEQRESIGYSWSQILEIEHAFEGSLTTTNRSTVVHDYKSAIERGVIDAIHALAKIHKMSSVVTKDAVDKLRLVK